ncbi:MAG: VOC family protein [Acidimicrobiaceae bacterium]|nr:VOC family protein [Acidimicrobiaceae bacterium]
MPDPDNHPLDALRAPIIPMAPDSAFAAALRARLERVLATPETDNPTTDQEEARMPRTEVTGEVLLRDGLSRNGTRTGDISYISLGVPDLARAKAFYGRVLGWQFDPGRLDPAGGQVENVIPQIGLWSGPQMSGRFIHGAVLAFRVDDLEEAIAAVRAHGGTATDARREPYGLTSDCTDNQGLDFYLHQLPAPGREAPENGAQAGDVSYVSLFVADGASAQEFYGAVLGWRFTPGGSPDGWQVDGPRPQVGVAGGRGANAGAVLCYQVADLAEAVVRVREAGGSATDPLERPYGLESSCTDDQGTPFYLHEFPTQPAS